MKKTLLFLLGLCVFLSPIGVQAGVFNVSTPADLATVLNTAENNGVADTINVAAGTYALPATLIYNPPTDASSLTIIGTAGAAATVLDGGGARQILNINTTGLADAGANIVINGLTFRNAGGNADGSGLSIQTTSGNVTIENSVFSANATPNNGGGALVQTAGGAVTIINNSFLGNTAGNDGGGIRVQAGTGTALLTANTFSGNSAGRDGGGLRGQSDAGTLLLTNNVLAGNTSAQEGGGARLETGVAGVTVGGGIVMTNNTVVNNSSTTLNAGGILATLSNATETARFYNNIIFNNTAPGLGADMLLQNLDGTSTILSNNDIVNFVPLVPVAVGRLNEISSPPLLSPDFHLLAGSPCIGAGSNDAPALPAVDFDGEARIMGPTLPRIVDIGADEFFFAVPPGPGPAPGPVPTGTVVTTLTLSARPRVIRRGGATVLRGVLADVNSTGLAGKRVAIKTGTRTIKNVTTKPGGAYSLKIRPARTRKFSAAFAGDATYRPAASRVVRVVVR